MATPSPRETHIKQMSSKLLNMKFMQRSAQAEIRSKLEEEKAKSVSEAHWVLGDGKDEASSSRPAVKFVVENSYLEFTETPIVGRKSFKSFNREIEALAQAQVSEQKLARSEQIDKRESISDKDMAARYKNLKNPVKGSGNRIAKKRKKAPAGLEEVAAADGGCPEEVGEGSAHGTSQRFKFLKPTVAE